MSSRLLCTRLTASPDRAGKGPLHPRQATRQFQAPNNPNAERITQAAAPVASRAWWNRRSRCRVQRNETSKLAWTCLAAHLRFRRTPRQDTPNKNSCRKTLPLVISCFSFSGDDFAPSLYPLQQPGFRKHAAIKKPSHAVDDARFSQRAGPCVHSTSPRPLPPTQGHEMF